jgi:hypothetical protein
MAVVVVIVVTGRLVERTALLLRRRLSFDSLDDVHLK